MKKSSAASISAPLKKRSRAQWEVDLKLSDEATLRAIRTTVDKMLQGYDADDELDELTSFILNWRSCESLREHIREDGMRSFYYDRLGDYFDAQRDETAQVVYLPCRFSTFEEFLHDEGVCWCARGCYDPVSTDEEQEGENEDNCNVM